MGRTARDAIIINTHYAPWDMAGSKFTLSDIVEHEGLPGRWYFEHDLDPGQELDQLKWASWENRQSFWPVKEALLHYIREAGFNLVFEQYDQVGDAIFDGMTSQAYKENHRSVFVGVRTAP
ncbi:hypothetical protein [Roseicella aerolata]|uniref:Uncharacterized protein n=1 Tax=Roseicella aerolata TaxID=2883479 RepID=A0A9X1IIN6_9PROT|nr:hypothetical protein [Roseicella aerolata]MCB4825591.1 hypothetical protein [Roseicella aerolata]